jgi:hypothetical protein
VVEPTDTRVIAFAKNGTATVYAVPKGAKSVRVDQKDLVTIGFLIDKNGAWADPSTLVTFLGFEMRLDFQTDWEVLATGKSGATAGRTCRGTKC